MNISKITIGRLFNLGSYEHVRYELTIEVPSGESAATALIGAERILTALDPKSTHPTDTDIVRDTRRIDHMKELLAKDREEFERNYRGYVGTAEEYIERCEQSRDENIAKREKWQARARKARQLFDDLGGASQWKDAKLDWDNDDYEAP